MATCAVCGNAGDMRGCIIGIHFPPPMEKPDKSDESAKDEK